MTYQEQNNKPKYGCQIPDTDTRDGADIWIFGIRPDIKFSIWLEFNICQIAMIRPYIRADIWYTARYPANFISVPLLTKHK